ncbi:MAG: response regulator transcription factor [Deltaproteobacteria bacterium]|nr:response regulator transcription factor [Deltaproteobacteria bacterium]
MSAAGPTVHVVDDDAAIRDALAWLLASRGVAARTWDSAEAFLGGWSPELRGCLVLDVRMGGMSGIELFDRLQALGSGLPVLFLTGHGDVPLAVSALKKGAFDFVEKPFNDNQLVDRVLEAMRQDDARRQEREAEAGIASRLAQLTAREREVMERVARGDPNKAIADELAIALRTVEVHRSRVFEKMGVRSAVELARLLAQIGR